MATKVYYPDHSTVTVGDYQDYLNFSELVLNDALADMDKFLKWYEFIDENEFIQWIFENANELEESCEWLVEDVFYVEEING